MTGIKERKGRAGHDRSMLALCGTALICLFLWLGAGGSLQGNAAEVSASRTARAGEVAELKGEAIAKTGGADRTLASQAAVFVGDLIRTSSASRLVLRLGQRTTRRLGEQSEVRIVRYLVDAGGELDLTSGAIEFERTGAPANETLSVRSAYGLIAVRGTQFFAGPSRGRFAVFVARGQVSVTNNGQTVIVSAKEGTDIATSESSPTQPKAWAQQRIDEALASVR